MVDLHDEDGEDEHDLGVAEMFIEMVSHLGDVDDRMKALDLAFQQEAEAAKIVQVVMHVERATAESMVEWWAHYEQHNCPVAAEKLDKVMQTIVYYIAAKLYGGQP